MARNVSSFKIGLFILICGALGLAAVIWLGVANIFEETKTYVTFFDESVKGLQKDAVVNYRGVAVGRVQSIGLAPDGRLIQVLLGLSPEFMVDESVAIQLREQGLTGLRYLEIDTAPQDLEKLTPPLGFKPEYPVIPSYPSELEQLKSALQTVYDKINALDLKSLGDSWKRTADLVNGLLVRINEGVESEEWKRTIQALNNSARDAAVIMSRLSNATSDGKLKKTFDNLEATLDATRQASQSLAKQLKGVPPDTLAKMAKGWDKTIESGGTFLSSTEQRVSESTALLQQSLQQLNILLNQLNTLVQGLKEQPNRLVFPPQAPNPFERR